MKKVVRQLQAHLDAGDDTAFEKLVTKLDFHEIAEFVEDLAEHKARAFNLLPPELKAKVVLLMSRQTKQLILPQLSDFTLARLISLSDEDDATDIVQFLPDARRSAILEHIRNKQRKKIEELLKYHPETAGGLMDLNFIIVKPDFTVRDVAEKIQRHAKHENYPPIVVVADAEGIIIGTISYKRLLLADKKDTVSKLKEKLPIIPHTSGKRTILHLLVDQKSDTAGVVDDKGKILGIVHIRDLAEVVQIEATATTYRFAGVSRDEYALDPVRLAVHKRYNWLIINLATAFLAAGVVALFEGTIAQMAILAAYLPIVAGMGGNAGIQAMVVVTRGLALGDISWSNAREVIEKEIFTGLINGVIVGIIAAIAAIIFTGVPLLGFVLILSMIVNLIIAGLFGALTPLALKAMHIDPAIAGSVFLTTATDVFGFFVFLGLAQMILL